MDYSNSMDIPSEVIPKGFEYARTDIRKPERIQGLLKKGGHLCQLADILRWF